MRKDDDGPNVPDDGEGGGERGEPGGDWGWGAPDEGSAEADLLALIEHATLLPHSKCTREVVEEICSLLEEGHYIQTVTSFVGVSERSYFNWIERGQDELARLEEVVEEGGVAVVNPALIPHVVLVQLSARARATAHIEAMRRITRAGKGSAPEFANVKADMWFLERSMPDVWGGKQRLDVNVGGGIDLELIVERPLDALEARVIARGQIEADDEADEWEGEEGADQPVELEWVDDGEGWD